MQQYKGNSRVWNGNINSLLYNCHCNYCILFIGTFNWWFWCSFNYSIDIEFSCSSFRWRFYCFLSTKRFKCFSWCVFLDFYYTIFLALLELIIILCSSMENNKKSNIWNKKNKSNSKNYRYNKFNNKYRF